MPRILLVGEDELLLRTRAAVLRSLAADIVISDSLSALRLQSEQACDLLMLCHSIPDDIAADITNLFRTRWAHTPILLVASLRPSEWALANDVDAVSSAQPDRLIKRTAELLGIRPARSRAN